MGDSTTGGSPVAEKGRRRIGRVNVLGWVGALQSIIPALEKAGRSNETGGYREMVRRLQPSLPKSKETDLAFLKKLRAQCAVELGIGIRIYCLARNKNTFPCPLLSARFFVAFSATVVQNHATMSLMPEGVLH